MNVHGMDTDAGRLMSASDSDARLLWTVAPCLGIELDL